MGNPNFDKGLLFNPDGIPLFYRFINCTCDVWFFFNDVAIYAFTFRNSGIGISAITVSLLYRLDYLFWAIYTSEICESSLGYTARSEEHTSELQSRGHLVCR